MSRHSSGSQGCSGESWHERRRGRSSWWTRSKNTTSSMSSSSTTRRRSGGLVPPSRRGPRCHRPSTPRSTAWCASTLDASSLTSAETRPWLGGSSASGRSDEQTFSFRALESYVVFTSCPDGTGARLVEQYGATVPEVPEVYLTCNDPEPARERVTVEGSLRQAGSVALFSDSTQGVANDGSFAFQVPPVIGDVVAFDETRIAFRRSLLFDRPRQLSPIDLDVEGSPLTDVPLVFTESPAGQVTTFSLLETRSGTLAVLARLPAPMARVPAASALAPGDSLRVLLTLRMGAQIRGIDGPFEALGTPLELLPVLDLDVVPPSVRGFAFRAWR